MRHFWIVALFMAGGALLLSGWDAVGQPPAKKGAFKGKGFGGPGFERPLATEPRRGNPGASPDLTDADFRDILSHLKDFDANKDGKLSKSELPEMFARFFERADTNRDGALDAGEIREFLSKASTKTQAENSKRP